MWHISSSAADRLFAISNVILVIGAAAVLIGTIGAIVMSGIREQFANERISANETATAQAVAESDIAKRGAAEANERAATAEQRAAEANLEIERLKAPRSVSPEQGRRIADKLKPFPKLPFAFALMLEPEPRALMEEIAAALINAGWTRVPYRDPTHS